jgi:hypothetical protein
LANDTHGIALATYGVSSPFFIFSRNLTVTYEDVNNGSIGNLDNDGAVWNFTWSGSDTIYTGAGVVFAILSGSISTAAGSCTLYLPSAETLVTK